MRYLSTVEGKNFLITQPVTEIDELLMLNDLSDLMNKNIEIQTYPLHIMEQQKQAAKVGQPAVKRFAAQQPKTQSFQYKIKQRIVEAENRLNFLIVRPGETIARSSAETFLSDRLIDTLKSGVLSRSSY